MAILTPVNGIMTDPNGQSVGLAPKFNSNVFSTRVADMLTQLQDTQQKGAANLGGAANTLTTTSIGAGGAYNPQNTPEGNIANVQGAQAAFTPAITSINTQLQNANTAAGLAQGNIGILEKTFGPESRTTLNPGQTLVNQDGSVLYNGVTYNPTPVPNTNRNSSNYGQLDYLGTDGSFLSDAKLGKSTSNSQNPNNIGGVDFSSHATDPDHNAKVNTAYQNIERSVPVPNADAYDAYMAKLIGKKPPLTGSMILEAAQHYTINPSALLASLSQETDFGTSGKTAEDNNPGGIKYVNQAGATRGRQSPDPDGSFYAHYKSWRDGVFAEAEWESKHSVNNTVSNGNVVQQIATQVANPASGVSYDQGIARIESAYGSAGGFMATQLLPAILKINPRFNPAQSNAQVAAQTANTKLAGDTSALVDKTNATLDLLPDKFDAQHFSLKIGGSLFPGIATKASDLLGYEKTNKDDYQRTLSEARASANAVLSTAANLGVVTAGKTADSLLPDGMDKAGLTKAIATIKDLEEKTKKALANLANAQGGSTNSGGNTDIETIKAKHNISY